MVGTVALKLPVDVGGHQSQPAIGQPGVLRIRILIDSSAGWLADKGGEGPLTEPCRQVRGRACGNRYAIRSRRGLFAPEPRQVIIRFVPGRSDRQAVW